MSNKVIISARDLHLSYPRGQGVKAVISGLTLALQKGEMTCLLGRNGIGKSTLIKGLLGQLQPTRGEIFLKEKPLKTFSKDELAKNIAVVLTETNIPGNLTVEQLVALGRIPHTAWHGKLLRKDYEAIDQAISALKIPELRKERLSELSDGQRQKAMIARAFAQEGEIMILDEPTAHLDLVGRNEIMRLLQQLAVQESRAILVVTHNVELAIATAHHFWLLLSEKEMLSGKPEDLILSHEFMRLLPFGDFTFDLEKGRLVLPSQPDQLHLEGRESHVFWVKQALLKAGITALEKPIEVSAAPFRIRFDGKEFSRIAELTEHILDAPRV